MSAQMFKGADVQNEKMPLCKGGSYYAVQEANVRFTTEQALKQAENSELSS
jgi:hypothetical protein